MLSHHFLIMSPHVTAVCPAGSRALGTPAWHLTALPEPRSSAPRRRLDPGHTAATGALPAREGAHAANRGSVRFLAVV